MAARQERHEEVPSCVCVLRAVLAMGCQAAMLHVLFVATVLCISSSAAFVLPPSRLPAGPALTRATVGTKPNSVVLQQRPLAAAKSWRTATTTHAFLTNADIESAFTVACFLPQPFWLFLILAPNSRFTDAVMRPWWPTLAVSAVHLFIVAVSVGQPGGTAPIAEFMDVFDPNGEPQKAMMGMMRYPNFVSEEWSHVLAWDLFVGRFIWLDGRARGVFTPHSTLLCNLIGPPGLLLHFATCLVTGKGLPPTDPVDEPSNI